MGSQGRRLSGEEWGRFWHSIATRDLVFASVRRFAAPDLMDARQEKGWRGLVMVTLLGECGLRVGESCSLTWEHLRGVIDGAESMGIPGAIRKGGVDHTVVVSPLVRMVVRGWWGYSSELLSVVGGEPVLWVGSRRRGIGVRGAQHHLCRLGLAHLGRRVWPHDLRRTFGERVRVASDVRIAQLMLGHARLATTERYLGGSWTERVAVAGRLSAAVCGAESMFADAMATAGPGPFSVAAN